jgi:hypothetical protein
MKRDLKTFETAQQAANRIGVKAGTVKKWRDEGRLKPAGEIGKEHFYDPADVDVAAQKSNRRGRPKGSYGSVKSLLIQISEVGIETQRTIRELQKAVEKLVFVAEQNSEGGQQ